MSWSEIKKRKEEEKKNKSAKTSNSGISKVANTLTGNLWKNIGQNIITSQRNAEIRKQKEQQEQKRTSSVQSMPTTYKRTLEPTVTRTMSQGNNASFVKQSDLKNQKLETIQENTTWGNIVNFVKNTGRTLENIKTGAYTNLIGLSQTAIRDISDVDKAYSEGKSAIRNTLLPLLGDKGKQVNNYLNEQEEKNYAKRNEALNSGLQVLSKEKQKANEDIQRNVLGAKLTDSSVATKMAEIAPSIGQQIPGFALNAISPVASLLYFKGSAEANYYDDAISRGMDEKQAKIYSKLMSYVEAGTEQLSVGSISKGGKTITTALKGVKEEGLKKGLKAGFDVFKETAKEETANTLKSAFKDYGIGVAEEAFQEAITEPIQEFTAMKVAGEDKADWNNIWQRMLQSGFDGALSSAILAGANLGISSCQGIVTKIENGQDFTTEEYNTAIKDASQKINIEKLTTDQIKEKVNQLKGELQQPQVGVNKNVDQQIKTSQNETSQATDTTEALRQEARETLELLKRGFDEKTYNQMQELIETAPSEKALKQVVEDLNTELDYRAEQQQKEEWDKIDSGEYEQQNNDIEYKAMQEGEKAKLPLKQKQEVQLPIKEQQSELKGKSYEEIEAEGMYDYLDEYEASKVESPIKDRDINTIGKETNKNAYQYENPQVKPYFQEMAQQIGEDLAYVSSSDNRSIKKGGGTRLSTTTKAIDILHNEQGYSYDQIAKGLQNIIDDNGKENNAVSKKLELLIDEQLREGYTNALGKYVEPNQEYINNITEQYSLAEQPQQNNFKYEQSDNSKIDTFRQDASKYWDNSEKTTKLVNTIEKIINDKGYNIRLDDTLGDNVNGRIRTNQETGETEITINPNSNRKGEFIIGHELTHAIETQEMVDLVKKRMEKDGELRNAVEDLKKLYGTDDINGEVLADISGQLFGNQEFINNLSTEKPSVFKRIYDAIVSLANKITGNSNEALFIKDLKNKWEKAYRENNNTINEEQYSIETGNNQEKLENNVKKVYNIINKSITNSERNQVSSEVLTWRNNQDDGVGYIDLSAKGYKSYIYNKQGNNVETLLKVNGNEDFKNYIRKGIEDGTYKKSENINGWATNAKIQYRNNSNDNDVLSNRRNSKGNGGIYDTTNGQQTRNNGTKIIEQNSRNESIENSNKSSFSMDNKGRTLTKQQQERYKDISNKIKDENGNIKRFYHGTQRGDRVGNIFDPNKATSGPMAMFTDNQEIAQNYSRDKQDTSLSREYNTEWDLFKANDMNLDDYWNSLPRSKQESINNEINNIGFDDDWENIIHEKNAGDSLGNMADYYNKLYNNGLKALYQTFIEDGNLMFEDMAKFKQVLEYAGVENVSYLDPYKKSPKVYEVYLNLKNPFDTSEISTEMFNELETASKKVKKDNNLAYHADMWDKTNITPQDWIEKLKTDLENGTAHAWTQIPDWVTDVLKAKGYDGIVDTGGKHGGQSHQVAIPFYSEQIKNIDNENPTDNPDIRYSKQNNSWQDYLEKNYKSEGTTTDLRDIRLPMKEKQEVKAPMKQQDTTPYRTSEKIAQDQSISDLEAIREESEKVNTPELETAIEKQNELQKKFNAEKSPTIDFIKKKRSKEKVGFKKIKDTLAQKIVNKGHYVDKLANETGNKKLTWLYDRALNSFAEASVSIGDHQVDSNGKEIGKSIIDIFAPAEQANLSAEFEDYLLNKHNISRYAHEKGIFGKEISSEDSQKIVDNYEAQHPEFKEWSKEVSKYNDNNLKDLVNNGLVSQETYNKLREMYGDYVPTYRDITDNLSQYLDDDSVGGNTLRRATESNRDILSVQESMAEQTLAIKKAIRMNNLGVELFKTLNPSKSDIVLDGINYDGNAILTLGGEIISKAKDGNNTFTIFQDGDMTTFKISDELYSAFEKDTLRNRINNNEVARAIMTPIAKLTQAQRNLLTTYNIGFAMSNPFKDYFDALFNTKYNSAKFIKNYTKALYNIATNGDWYQTYKNNGATGNTYFDYEKGILPTKTKNPVKKFINGIKTVNEVMETAPRLAEFITTIEEGGSIDEALYNSAEITVNFKRGGDITKAVNKYGANFLNASIQGLDKAYRNLTGQNGWKGYASLMTKSMLFQIAPALLNGILLGDDDDYEDLPEYTKDNYFLFKMGNGKFFRIPKGRVQSVMGGIARRALETAQGKDVDWNSLVETTVNQIAPNNPLEDNILAPLIQAGTGKTWYGGDIESSRLQKLPVAERSDEKTDKLSKFLGEKLNISPKKINYVLDQYSGGIGDVVLPMLTPEAENNIIEDKLSTDSVLKNKNVSKFYSTLEEAEKNKNSSKATDEDLLKYKYLSSASSEAGKLYSQKREVQNSNKSDKEKREQVREIQKQINNIVEKALSDVDKMSAKGSSAKIGDQEYYKDNGSWKKLTEKEKTKLKDTSLDTYSSYKESLKNYESKKGENLTDKDKIQVLRDSNYTKKEKSALYSKTMSNDTYYPTLEKSGIDIDEYMDYKLAYSNGKFIADKDKNGKTIIGSGKNKVINYLNKNITGAGNRLLIAGKYYSLQNSEKQKLAEYVNKIATTKEERIDIYKQLTKNFTVQNGNVYMKVSK